MKTLIALILLSAGLLLAACHKTQQRWVPVPASDVGNSLITLNLFLPAKCNRNKSNETVCDVWLSNKYTLNQYLSEQNFNVTADGGPQSYNKTRTLMAINCSQDTSIFLYEVYYMNDDEVWSGVPRVGNTYEPIIPNSTGQSISEMVCK